MHPPIRHVVLAIALLRALAAAAQNPATELEAPTIEVIGTTPLPGLGTPVNQVPANVQAATGNDIRAQATANLGEYLDNNLGSVTVNHGQNNPFQPDVNFRGLSASPLLGTPQGVSVFMDGVRINEPFGDVVNWDLVPQNAISTINLIPGSNPVFGLNTLGAALAINTKSGFQYPGGSISAQAGSWGRRVGEFEYGGHGDKNDWFLAGTWFDEDGWRDFSPSEVRQLFTKAGREEADTDFDVSLMLADNDLQGTQALPLSFLGNREQAYTWPDRNQNELLFLNGRASHFIAEDRLLAGNLYIRRYKNENFSSNVNDDCEEIVGNCAIGILSGGADPQAINDLSEIRTKGLGGSLQMTFLDELAGRKNQLTVGISADLGDTTFTQFEEEADFTTDRGTVGSGVFTLETDVQTKNGYYGIYLTDTVSLSDQLSLTVSGRYNYARVRIEDRTGTEPQLNGDHKFTRFNPAVGLNLNPSPTLTAYVAYSEGMRAPTPVELTCADPNAPCRLPNNFLADPPLEKVVSKTMEAGARGRLSPDIGWSLAVYNTDLVDDIQFISAAGAGVNAGFFDNVGKTRRRGAELGAFATLGSLRLVASYAYLRATFESAFAIANEVNSSAVDTDGDTEPDTIFVNPGDRIPGFPDHALKLRVEYGLSEKFVLGANLHYFSAQFARGDENNQDANGKIPGYTLVNLDARYQAARRLQIFARVQNLFDKEYETLGVLGENFFVSGTFDASNVQPEQFRSVGAPRAVWAGLRYQFAN
ncbi:MAG TPA: TonB-dependent receptor [Burkholderiales bacterium]|nr:TonB-dependent receptor [Burkholderiales bacterium]